MGQKLKTEYYVRDMNVLRLSKTLTRTYCGNYIYEDGNLSQVLFDGGYITFNGSDAEHHYYIQDHLGRSTSRKGGAFIAKRRKNIRSVVKAK